MRTIPVILGTMVLARLLLATLVYARPELAIANDSDRYIPIANSILAGKAYAWNVDHPGELLNTVGYPLFLAGVFAILGRDPGDVALAQLAVSGVLALIMYALLSRWIGAIRAFFAAAILLLDPLTALWSMTILTEAMFAVTLCLSALLLWSWVHSRNTVALGLAGLLSALACLVKPFAMLIVATWAAGVVFVPEADRAPIGSRLWRTIRLAMLYLLPSILLIAPWFVRNGMLWRCPALSSVDRVTMRDYMAAKVLAEVEHLSLDQVQQRLREADPGNCPTENSKYWKIILEHPAVYLRLHAAGTVPVLIGTNFDRWLQYFGEEYVLPDLWRPYMDGGWTELARVIGMELRAYPLGIGLMIILVALQLVLYVLALVGAFVALRTPSKVEGWAALMLLAAILILIIVPGQGGHERFRVPVQPLLAILIAYTPLLRQRGMFKDRMGPTRPTAT